MSSIIKYNNSVPSNIVINTPPFSQDIHKKLIQAAFSSQLQDSSLVRFQKGAALLEGKKLLSDREKTIFSSCAAGSISAFLALTTGPLVALHEVVGHGMLGMHLTNDYTHGTPPHYHIDAWDNFKAFLQARSFKTGLVELYRFLIGYNRTQDGVSGVAYGGNGTPNALGTSMGRDLQSAWISIAGSVPQLFLDTATVTGGMFLRKKSPGLGYFLLSLGLINHLNSSMYPISAAFYSNHQLRHPNLRGHDFANFSVKIGNLTGLSPRTVAIGTALGWTAIVPLAALMTYFYQKSHEANIIPDVQALKQ